MRARARASSALAALSALLLLASLGAAAPARAAETPEQAALRTLDAFMAAFNARDVEAWIGTLHFPHVRIASGRVAVFADAAAFRAGFEFARFAEQTGWSRSEWTERRVIQAGPDKVHVAVVFTRYRADGSVLSRFESLYIVTRLDGRWGVQARSSYAP
ncbi:MAG TPA: hypothetical protein VII78_05045 [Myxococcota bacterium]